MFKSPAKGLWRHVSRDKVSHKYPLHYTTFSVKINVETYNTILKQNMRQTNKKKQFYHDEFKI